MLPVTYHHMQRDIKDYFMMCKHEHQSEGTWTIDHKHGWVGT